jgi:hypothetical protein
LPYALLQRVTGIIVDDDGGGGEDSDDNDKNCVKQILLLASYKANIFAHNHYTVTEGNFGQLFMCIQILCAFHLTALYSSQI